MTMTTIPELEKTIAKLLREDAKARKAERKAKRVLDSVGRALGDVGRAERAANAAAEALGIETRVRATTLELEIMPIANAAQEALVRAEAVRWEITQRRWVLQEQLHEARMNKIDSDKGGN